MRKEKNLGVYAMKGATPWNTGKIKYKDFLIDNYKIMSNDEIGRKIGLTRDAVRSKLKRMGIYRTAAEIKINYQNNKHKCAHLGKDHPLFGKFRSDDVKEKISKKLKYRTIPYKKSEIYSNGKKMITSHLVWKNLTGNPVPKGFAIHHIDFNPQNNQPNNLYLMSFKDHGIYHSGISKIIRSNF